MPREESLLLKNFNIFFNEDVWLQASGRLDKLLSSSRQMKFTINRSEIRLEPLSRVLNSMPGIPSMKLAGTLSLSPVEISGNTGNLKIRANVTGKNIYYKSGKSEHTVRDLGVLVSGIFDFDSKKEATAAAPLPFINLLHVEKLHLDYNGLAVDLTGSIKEQNINFQLGFANLILEKFTTEASATGSGKVLLTGNFKNPGVVADIGLNGLRYRMENSRSGMSSIALNAVADLNFSKPFVPETVFLRKFSCSQKNISGNKALEIGASGKLQLQPMSASIGYTLDVNLSRLLSTLTLPLKDTVITARNSIGNKVTLAGNLDYRSEKKADLIKGRLNARLPGIEINDLLAVFSVEMNEKKISIKEVALSAFHNVMDLKVHGGIIKEKDRMNPDLKLAFSLKAQNPSYLFNGITYQGNIGFNASVGKEIVTGTFSSSNSNIKLASGSCPGDTCRIFLINSINADIPIKHDLTQVKSKQIKDTDKSAFIKTSGMSMRPNFTIHSVVGSHPSLKNTPFMYVSNTGAMPGFSSSINYAENILRIDEMKINLLDGVVYSKDIMLNVGSGSPVDMEYAGILQVRDIDLKQLMHPKVQKKIDDGKIRADINLDGRNLTEPIENLNLFFSVFSIGRDFSKSAMNVISPQNAVTDFIVDSYAINDINVKLSRGLVYATISFEKTLFSRLIQIKNNKITQERMPLANFLRRAQGEIGTYK